VVRATQLLQAGDLEELEREFCLLSDSASESDVFWRSHEAFHHMLMRPVLTPRLDRLITELWHASERYVRVIYMETDALERLSAHERHLPLLEAAQSGSESEMRKAITAHLQCNEKELIEGLQLLETVQS
jgi:DNA-binding GntR family transcriptional regulator